MLLWTALVAGWFASVVAGGSLTTLAVGLAVGGIFGVLWLIGLLMLALFLTTPPP